MRATGTMKLNNEVCRRQASVVLSKPWEPGVNIYRKNGKTSSQSTTVLSLISSLIAHSHTIIARRSLTTEKPTGQLYRFFSLLKIYDTKSHALSESSNARTDTKSHAIVSTIAALWWKGGSIVQYRSITPILIIRVYPMHRICSKRNHTIGSLMG